ELLNKTINEFYEIVYILEIYSILLAPGIFILPIIKYKLEERAIITRLLF
ncbi:uncharacterized protein K444DRAFT_544026, partial [Hyaloscypha bicolor E]